MKKISVFFIFILVCVFLSCSSAESKSVSNEFARGFDASFVSQIEENGVFFYAENGEKKDVFNILKENGVTWIRLRLWHSPDSFIPGNNSLSRTLEIAKRIKAEKLKFLLDIHFSDTWADPACQKRPAAWDNCNTIEELSQKVSEYTQEVLKSLKDFPPDMVQIGNEINPGLLVTASSADSILDFANPLCSSWKSEESVKNLEKVLTAASREIRKFNPKIKIMIHLSSQKDDTLEWWFNKFPSLDFDFIGLSWYPYYEHGNLDSLKANISCLKQKYGKEIIVVETAWAWTDQWNDETANLFGDNCKKKGAENLSGYLSGLECNAEKTEIFATPQNQALILKKIMDAVFESGGSGVFYWGGDWICVKNIQNNWENQALFDFDGKALPALSVFNQFSGKIK